MALSNLTFNTQDNTLCSEISLQSLDYYHYIQVKRSR
jgi:hypothetical protein